MNRVVTRRGAIKSLAAGSLALAARPSTSASSNGFASSSRSETFPQPGYDAGNTAASPATGPVDVLHADWQVGVESITATPLVGESVVVVLTQIGRGNRIDGFDRSTGDHRWSVDVGDAVVGGMLTTDGEYAFTSTIAEPRILAISLADGAVEWESTVDELAGGFYAEPRVSGDSLFLQDGAGWGLYSFDTATGEMTRVYDGNHSRFAVDEQFVYGAVASPRASQHGVAVFDREQPEDRSFVETTGRPGRPSVAEGTLFVGTSEGVVHAVESASGETRWSAPVDDWAVSLAVTDDTVLARTNSSVSALDRDDGTERWRIDRGTSRTLVGGDVVYVGREDGVDLVDLESGSTLQTYRDSSLAAPVSYLSVIDGALFAASISGTLQRLEEVTVLL